jgi:hypothetical protein
MSWLGRNSLGSSKLPTRTVTRSGRESRRPKSGDPHAAQKARLVVCPLSADREVLRAPVSYGESRFGYGQDRGKCTASLALTIPTVTIEREKRFRRTFIVNRATGAAARERCGHKSVPPFVVRLFVASVVRLNSFSHLYGRVTTIACPGETLNVLPQPPRPHRDGLRSVRTATGPRSAWRRLLDGRGLPRPKSLDASIKPSAAGAYRIHSQRPCQY